VLQPPTVAENAAILSVASEAVNELSFIICIHLIEVHDLISDAFAHENSKLFEPIT